MESAVSYKVISDGIAEVVFNDPVEKVNILTNGVMEALDGIITEAASSIGIKLLVFKSAKGVFIAGADIREIKNIKSADEAEDKSRLGQELFNKIAGLPFATVCVINGACLGGGLELALACDYRIVSDNPSTRLGLPETTLGIMPGFGGSYRLPRLIGLVKGIGMILPGRSVSGKEALRYGLADALYPEAFLDDKTNEFIKRILSFKKFKTRGRKQKKSLSEKIMEDNFLGRAFIYGRAKKELLKKTRGFYEAPLLALKTIFKNYNKKINYALMSERRAFSKLAASPQAKKLIDIYFLNEELKKGFKPPAVIAGKLENSRIKTAGVLGAGKMGGAIAWLFSNSGIHVRMKDISWQYVAAGFKAVRDIYNELEKRRKLDDREAGLKMQMVSGTVDYSGFLNTDVVIEAIIEDKDEKLKTLRELEDHVREDTVIATNTSSFSIRDLSAALKHPDRFLGFHLFNPVNRMPLIEVVRGEKTSDLALFKMINLAKYMKKIPVLVSDSSGFLVNRILMAYLSEAVMMMEEGIEFNKIDSSVYNYGMPMGPFTLMDEIGIRTAIKVAIILENAYPDRAVKSRLMPEFVLRNELIGRAGKSGFYLYDNGRKKPNPIIYEILKEMGIDRNNKVTGDEIAERCILRMINEAAYCLGEKIVENPGFLDMALILGTGFPPFRGGLLRTADEMGVDRISARLRELEESFGQRFKSAPLILELQGKKGRFYQ